MKNPPASPAEVWYSADRFEKFIGSRADPEAARAFCLEHALRKENGSLGWSRIFDLWLLSHFPASGALLYMAPQPAASSPRQAQPWELMPYLEQDGECPFPGCAELRAEYQAEVNALGDACGGCQMSAVRLKFMHRINERLASDL